MWSLISIFMRPAQRYDDFKLVKFKKPAKLLSSLPVSLSRVLPRHITVPFGAEAPSGHVAQASAIPPPSWGLLSDGTDNRRQRQRQTERLLPEPSNILKRFQPLYYLEWRYFMKKVSKL